MYELLSLGNMKDTKSLLLALLSIGLVCTWIYHLYDKTIYSRQIAGIPVKQAELLTANFRDSLKKNYGLISHDLDARFNSNNTKVDSLNKNEELIIKFDQISQLKNEINTILNNATANSADLDLAQQTIRTEARVPTASTIFEGHFPGYPLMPGVLLIEAMAQTSGWLVIAVTKFSRMPFFAALKEAKLRSFVSPGQSLSLSAKLLHEGSGYAVTRADIRCDGKLACNAEITFRLVEFPNPEFRASMEKMAAILEFPIGALAHG